MLSVTSPARAAELSAPQKKLLDETAYVMKSVESAVKVATDSAGADDSPLTGSRAKLTASRLANPIAQLPQATERLAKLPADNPDVKAMQARVDAAQATITKLQARIDGKAPAVAKDPPKDPAGGPAAEPALPAAGAEVRLNYLDEKEFKDAEFHLRSAQGMANAAADFTAKVKATENLDTLRYVDVHTAISTLDNARAKLKLAVDRIPKLPANGVGVAGLKADCAAVQTSIDSSSALLTPIHDKLAKLVDPKSYPDFAADRNRVRGFSQSYASPDMLEGRPTQAAELVKQLPAAKLEAERVSKAYQPILFQQTDQGAELQAALAYFAEKSTAFEKAVTQKKAELPGEIDKHLADAKSMADDAVKDHNPLFFRGGIPQRIGFAETKIVLYDAIDPEGAKTAKQKLAATQADLKVRQASLRDVIISSNELPPDRYTGADKAALGQNATKAWKEVQPAAEVLAVRMPSEKWERETLWRYENRAWHLIDQSRLQVQLLVKHDATTAVVRPVNLVKDHLSDDKVTQYPMDAMADEIQPHRFVMLDKVK